MGGVNYYLLASLPALGELGTPPPLSYRDFLTAIEVNKRARLFASLVALEEDLLCLQSTEQTAADLFVLPDKNLSRSGALRLFFPQSACPQSDDLDVIMPAYFEALRKKARELRSSFISEWVRFEVSLRSAIGRARAQKLGVEYRETPAVEADRDLTALAADWSAAENAVDGALLVEGVRWSWLTAHDRWYQFTDDELIAYGTKLLSLLRWERIAAADARRPSGDMSKYI